MTDREIIHRRRMRKESVNGRVEDTTTPAYPVRRGKRSIKISKRQADKRVRQKGEDRVKGKERERGRGMMK